MKEFFKTCLEELELKAGVKQLFWLKQEAKDQADFDKKMELLIGSMVLVSEKFDYIPESMQQKYILQEMVEDQNYDAMNSRTVWKWLDRHKGAHITHSQFTETDLSQGKYFDELDPGTQDLVNNFLRDLATVGKKVPQMTHAEIQAEGQERIKDPNVQRLKEQHEEMKDKFGVPMRQKFIVGERCPDCYGEGKITEAGPDGESLVTCYYCEGTKEVNRVEVYATSIEEARKAYNASI